MSRASEILDLVEDEGEFAKRRQKSVDLRKDWSKSQSSKRGNSRNKATNRWATKRYSHSPAGRTMHRKVGRLLATKTKKGTSSLSED